MLNFVEIYSNRYRLFYFFTEYDLCPCLVLPESFKSAISTMLDVSLLKDHVFMLIGISNVFGMAGLYVPFVYLVDAAKLNVSSIDHLTPHMNYL